MAPPDVVDSWLDELGNGPDTNNLLLDWRHSMSSVWNSEVIVILAKGFIQDVGDRNQLPLIPEKCPSLDVIKKNCYKKLQALQHEYTRAIVLGAEEQDARSRMKKQTSRRDTRRAGVTVIILPLSSSPHVFAQTLLRRKRIIDTYRSANDKLWEEVEAVVDTLDQGAMSSDHTDDESDSREKRVVRSRLPWRSPELASLMEALETYHIDETLAGNKALPRDFRTDKIAPSKRKPVRGLPRSFYDAIWLQSRTQAQRHQLRVMPPMPIPVLLVVSVFCLLFVQTAHHVPASPETPAYANIYRIVLCIYRT